MGVIELEGGLAIQRREPRRQRRLQYLHAMFDGLAKTLLLLQQHRRHARLFMHQIGVSRAHHLA